MKKLYIIMIILILTFFGCSTKDSIQEPTIEKPVKIMSISSVEDNDIIEYYGIVTSQDMVKLAFKSSSKLDSIDVKVGQKIAKGDELASLDTTDLALGLKAAEANLKAATALYNKAVNGATDEEKKQVDSKVKQAKDTMTFAMNNYERIKNLYEQGSISKNDYDKVKLEYDIQKNNYNVALEGKNSLYNGAREEDKEALKEQVNQAQADYDYKKSLLDDAVLISEIDGSVVDILYEVGELVPIGHPVIVVKGNTKLIESGVISEDMKKISVNDECLIIGVASSIKGKVLTVASVPSIDSRVFKIEIVPEDSDTFIIGDIVDVEYTVGKEKSIWIPLSSIMSSEIDYVYKVVDGKIDKVSINILSTRGTNAKVEGLDDGDAIVVEGMKNLRLGDKVKIVK